MIGRAEHQPGSGLGYVNSLQPTAKYYASCNRILCLNNKINHLFSFSSHFTVCLFCLLIPLAVSLGWQNKYRDVMRNLTTSSHCVLILQVVNSKRPLLSCSSQDTILAKTNRHLDKIKGWTGGLEDIEKATNDLLQVFISSPPSFLCVFYSLPCHLPLSHSLTR